MTFSLSISPNGRYLVNQDGQPFLYHADTGWRIAQRLSLPDAIEYLDERRAGGFNTLHMHAINFEREGPANYTGVQPFDPIDDLTQPNEAYWQHVDAIFEAATERGFVLAISAAWFGYGGAGWRPYVTVEAAGVYGRFLGQRYSHLQNIVWIQGGDNNPGDRADAAAALAGAIREVALHHLHTYHASSEHASSAFFHAADWLDINMAYTYHEAYKQVLAEYNRSAPIRPIVLGETGYENEANTGFPWTTRLVRQQPYWALLSGAAGHAHGSAKIWCFDTDWRDVLAMPALQQMRHVYDLFATRAWHLLVPDQQHRLVTAGYEEGATYAAAAHAADGSFALVYLPTTRTITVDLSLLNGPIAASWFDPTNGASQPIDGRPLDADQIEQFMPPGSNSAGDPDWVLALDPASEVTP